MKQQSKEELINILVAKEPIGGFDPITGENLQEKARKEYENKTIEEIKQLLKQQILFNKLESLRSDVLHLYIAKRNDEASEKIIDYLKEKYTFKTIKDDKTSEMWVYVQGVYEPNGESTIKEEVRTILEESYTTHKANIIIEKIKTDTYINQEEFFTQQEKHPYLLPVKNGILDIKKKKLLPFSDEYIFFNKINASYNVEADCPNIKSFIKQITKNDQDVRTIQELFGFVLCKEYFIEKAFMLYGSNGRNGKSKLLQIMTKFLGVENTSSVGLQEIEEDDFAVANLFGKMVNISADISNSAMQHTGKFKKLTGRDTIQANRKFKTYLKFVNYAKMIFASNELPIVYTVTEAFWLRWVIIEFPYQFLPQKEIDALQGQSKDNCRLQDPDVIEKILTQEELNGLLNWSLEGFHRLLNNRDFSNNETASKIRSDWLRRSSSARAFCEDFIDEDYDGYISKIDFQRKYALYCKEHNLKPQSSKAVRIILENEIGATEFRPNIEGERFRAWSGLKWKIQEPVINVGKEQTKLFLEEEAINDANYLRVADAVADGYTTFSDLELIGFSDEQIAASKASGDIIEHKPGIFRKI